MATLAALEGEADRAARLKGAEVGLREVLGIPLRPVMQVEWKKTVVRAKEILGDEDFIHAWERGHVMSLEEAVAFALEEHA